MPLSSRTFEVNFSPIDQQTPTTSSVPGQMRYIRNGQVSQFDERSIRLSKRNGFRQLTKNVRDVTSGNLIGTAGFPVAPSLMSSLAKEQVVVSDSHPYVLAEDEPSWGKFPYVYSPTTVTQRPVYTANTQILNPDGASIGDLFMRTWSQVHKNTPTDLDVWASLEDADGSPVRPPFLIAVGDANFRAKVVADGTYFWIVFGTGTDMWCRLYDRNGSQVAETLFRHPVSSALPWDLTYQQGKVIICHATPTSTECIGVGVLSFDGISTISEAFSTLGFNALGNLGCAWMENRTGDGNVYLLTSHYDPDGYLPVERAFQIANIGTTPTIAHYYGIGNNSGSFIYDDDGYGDTTTGLLVEMTGVATAAGLYIQLSFVDGDGTTRNFSANHKLVRMVMMLVTTASVLPTPQRTLTSVIAASRTFQIDVRNVILVYYASGIPAIIFNPGSGNDQRYLPEPTYFLIDIATGQVCGEFDYASAAMEWERTGYPVVIDGQQYGPFNFCVGHVFNDGAGFVHASVGYQAQAINKVVATNDIFGPAERLTSTVGFQDLKFGGAGQAIEYASELLMPGPLATSFTGQDFGENNLTLAPEQPVLAAGTGGSLTLTGKYSYIFVFERTLPNGDRVQSGVSVPQTVQLSGGQNKVTCTIFPLFMTSYRDVIISIYRNTVDPITLVPGTTHYKITDDLAPLFNDPNNRSQTFVDTFADTTIAVSEILYTDTGFVNRIPCPPFSVGCVFENRIIVYGLDGAIWFSGEKSEGTAIWFSDDPSFRIAMPTPDPVKNLLPVDGRIGILCEDSQWAFTGGGFPGPNGLGGNLQTPQVLPFNNGATGFSATFPLGAVYSSSAGDAWVFTRGLENKHLGEKAVADFRGRRVVGIAIDKKQRIGFALFETDTLPAAFEVYDQVAQLWCTYNLPTRVWLCHSIQGNMAYVDDVSVWMQDDRIYVDTAQNPAESAAILSSYQTELINIGAVKNFNRIWNQIIQGEYKGPHTLHVTTVADSNGQDVSTKYVFDPKSDQPFSYSIPPVQEEAARVSFLFEDTFTPADSFIGGDSFTIELIAFNVAVDNGLTQLAPFRQISPVLVPVSGVVTGSSQFVTVLRLNGAQDLKVLPGATTFTFPIGIPSGQAFNVTKKAGPGTVLNPTGTAGVANTLNLTL